MFLKLASSVSSPAFYSQTYRISIISSTAHRGTSRSFHVSGVINSSISDAASLLSQSSTHELSNINNNSTSLHANKNISNPNTTTTNNNFNPIANSSTPLGTTRTFTSINCNTPYNLCFLRHGQSTWNRDNRFIGWTDTPLTEDGVLEARVAGRMLRASGMLFDEAHTSLLRRSIRTMNLVLMEMGQEYIPVYKHWRLNERSYGDLVGLNKKEVVKQYGADQVKRWRRSYDEPPPPMRDDHEHHPMRDPRYRLMLDEIPSSESLKCTRARTKIYWDDVIAPSLRSGKTVMIVGHENNLRSIIMRLEGISPEDIINLNLPRAVPLAYRLNKDLKPIPRSDGKLDEATGMLRGTWLGGDEAVQEILDRDNKQVYDTSIEQNLEQGSEREKWRRWTEMAIGQPEDQSFGAHSRSHIYRNLNSVSGEAVVGQGTKVGSA
mmetsp:Transcript_10874/g.21592  ORF Transcript_10874/g.21592 Transcript_10874/m.21592 type:complete len:435 (+) Transcript_10874:150-1454(+)